jgi:hypothetical protein
MNIMKKLFAILLIVMLLAGCSQQTSDQPQQTTTFPALLQEPTGPEATTAVTPLSEEALATSIDYALLKDADASQVQLINALLSTRTITVISYTENGSDVQAQVCIKVADMYSIAKSLDTQEWASNEEYDAALLAAIPSAPTKETTLSVSFVGTGKIWEPEETFELLDAYYGGLLTYSDEVFGEVVD